MEQNLIKTCDIKSNSLESQCASDSECATAAAVLMQPQPQFVTFVVEPVICIFIPNVHFARRSV